MVGSAAVSSSIPSVCAADPDGVKICNRLKLWPGFAVARCEFKPCLRSPESPGVPLQAHSLAPPATVRAASTTPFVASAEGATRVRDGSAGVRCSEIWLPGVGGTEAGIRDLSSIIAFGILKLASFLKVIARRFVGNTNAGALALQERMLQQVGSHHCQGMGNEIKGSSHLSAPPGARA